MKVAILGDIHGDTEYLDYALDAAKIAGAEMMIQLGDFGFDFSSRFLSALKFVTDKHQIPLMALRGNHDDPSWFKQYYRMNYVSLIPDGTFVTIGNKRVAFLGGAVSIDRDFRKEHFSWWKDERVNPNIVRNWAWEDQKADVLLSHESPIIPPTLGPPPMPISQNIKIDCNEDRLWVSTAVEILEVSEVYHGHYHHRETYEVKCEDHKKVLVEGLSCDGAELSDAVIIREF